VWGQKESSFRNITGASDSKKTHFWPERKGVIVREASPPNTGKEETTDVEASREGLSINPGGKTEEIGSTTAGSEWGGMNLASPAPASRRGRTKARNLGEGLVKGRQRHVGRKGEGSCRRGKTGAESSWKKGKVGEGPTEDSRAR